MTGETLPQPGQGVFASGALRAPPRRKRAAGRSMVARCPRTRRALRAREELTHPSSSRAVKSSRRGYTIVEVCVAVALLALIGGPVVLVGMSGTRYYSKESTRAELQSRAETAIHKVMRDLIGVRLSTILPNPTGNFGSPMITFQVASGMAGGAVVLGPVMRLTLEYEGGEIADGIDNDGDGLVDEGQLRWTRDLGGASETTTILCTSVREYLEGESLDGTDENGNGLQDERGFHVELVGNALTFRLTLEELNQEGQLVTKTVEGAVIALD